MSKDDRSARSTQQKVESVTFTEDDQLMQMEVHQEDYDDHYPSDEENEVSFRNSQTSQASSYEQGQTSDEESYDKGSHQTDSQEIESDNGKSSEVQEYQDRVDDLDQQVRVKLLELQSLMQKGGMEQSAALLVNQEPTILWEKTAARATNAGKNANDNHKTTMIRKSPSMSLKASNSEATIYDKAISKRFSSSSDENDLVNDVTLDLEI